MGSGVILGNHCIKLFYQNKIIFLPTYPVFFNPVTGNTPLFFFGLNKNMSKLNKNCSCLSSYRSRKFKKIQFARSEMAYCQLSCKVSTQDTVIVIGSLGHPQLSEYSSENLMPLSALLLKLFHVEYGRREHFAKSDTNFRLPRLTLKWHISVKF